jgi:hypothetical protein
MLKSNHLGRFSIFFKLFLKKSATGKKIKAAFLQLKASRERQPISLIETYIEKR